MLGNDLNDFLNDMYYNPEKEIVYDKQRYMVVGYIDETGELYTLGVYTIEKNSKELFKCTSKERSECVEAFEQAKIFEGKTIYEAEKDIEVIYG